jgi:hypothetical protein
MLFVEDDVVVGVSAADEGEDREPFWAVLWSWSSSDSRNES